MENVKNLTKCEINPTDYKLCSPYTCVTRETPCRTGCGPYEYTCANSGCIQDTDLCNTIDNCGDNSDENICNRQQTTTELLSTPVLAGIIAGCLVFLFIIIVVTVVFFKWKRRRRKTTGKDLSKDCEMNKEDHLHENKALVTSASMEDSNERHTTKKERRFQNLVNFTHLSKTSIIYLLILRKVYCAPLHQNNLSDSC
ncbi:Hypothetical predicted protein [Mytilus galloprovincialis]|uniref:Uncharacterized protein n=1 Tax=Mytilus galloprovincialis TaxID=29158 RepID=A0A8B6F5G7_MYTGA|nr:Hypothetical predicted protein [Mytilus galloprovincialis]